VRRLAGRTWRFLRPRLHVPAWRETLLLLAGILSSQRSMLGGDLKPKQARRFIRCVLWARSPWERSLRRDLVLAAHLLGEGPDEVDVRFLRVGWWVRARLNWATLPVAIRLKIEPLRRALHRRWAQVIRSIGTRLSSRWQVREPKAPSGFPSPLRQLISDLSGSPEVLWASPVGTRALRAAEAIAGDGAMAWALIWLAPYLPESLKPRALAAAEAIADEGARARALGELAPRLPESLLERALERALAAAEAIADEGDRARALIWLAPYLPESLLERALAAAEAIADEGDRARALGALAPRLSEAQAKKAATPDLLTHGWRFRNRAKVHHAAIAALIAFLLFIAAQCGWLLHERALGHEVRLDGVFMVGTAAIAAVLMVAEILRDAISSSKDANGHA